MLSLVERSVTCFSGRTLYGNNRCRSRTSVTTSSTIVPGIPLSELFRVTKVFGATGVLLVAK
jgi:hypothetical protein